MIDAKREIQKLDGKLLTAGERLAKYRAKGEPTVAQQGVVDRLLDQRLVLMDRRDSVEEVRRGR